MLNATDALFYGIAGAKRSDLPSVHVTVVITDVQNAQKVSVRLRAGERSERELYNLINVAAAPDPTTHLELAALNVKNF